LLDMSGYLADALSARRDEPGEDMLSLWVQDHIEADGGFDLPNLIADASNLLVGGIATTGHMLGSTMRLLLSHPETLARVRQDGAAVVRAIEEALRLEAPIQWNTRLALREVEIGEVTLPAGALVIVAYCSANRDEDHFEDPDAFEIDRDELKDHIGFGHGAHFCMGAPLARLEGRIAFERLLDRFEDLGLSDRNDYQVLDSIALRGMQSLWLRLGERT
jgi:cytochrome P450